MLLSIRVYLFLLAATVLRVSVSLANSRRRDIHTVQHHSRLKSKPRFLVIAFGKANATGFRLLAAPLFVYFVHMCICHQTHHHHRAPCTRPPSYSCTYTYCSSATIIPSLSTSSAPILSPCSSIFFSPDFTILSNPCMAGCCLPSPECEDGTCRLQDLGGLWICCQCGGRGNRLLNCRHRPKGRPDTFCYHDICWSCKPDRGEKRRR